MKSAADRENMQDWISKSILEKERTGSNRSEPPIQPALENKLKRVSLSVDLKAEILQPALKRASQVCGQMGGLTRSCNKVCWFEAERKPWTGGQFRQDHDLTDLSRKLCYSKSDTPNLPHNKVDFNSNDPDQWAGLSKKKARLILVFSRMFTQGNPKPKGR